MLFIIFLIKNIFIEVWLNYNVVLIAAVEQSDSVAHMYTFFFIFISIMVYQRILNIIPCGIQEDLVFFMYSIYTSLCLLIPNFQSNPLHSNAIYSYCHYSFIHLTKLVSSFFVTSVVLGSEDIMLNKTDSYLHGI